MTLSKLKRDDFQSTDDLIAQIETRDRNFRLAQTTFMICTFLALLIVIFIQNKTLSGVQRQLSEAKKTANTQEIAAVDARDKIIRRLDCMTVFFSQKDRTNLSISNIDQCTLDRAGDIQRFFTTDSKGQPTTTNTEQPEGQVTPKATAP